jgi:lipopolysaccharide biosynthesis regulator YciM
MSRNALNADVMLNLVADAVQKKQMEPARMMLQQILQQDPRNIRAMMWMAKIASSNQERNEWLQRILKIEPRNRMALQALKKAANANLIQRNRWLLRAGVAAYVVIVTIISLVYIMVSLP